MMIESCRSTHPVGHTVTALIVGGLHTEFLLQCCLANLDFDARSVIETF